MKPATSWYNVPGGDWFVAHYQSAAFHQLSHGDGQAEMQALQLSLYNIPLVLRCGAAWPADRAEPPGSGPGSVLSLRLLDHTSPQHSFHAEECCGEVLQSLRLGWTSGRHGSVGEAEHSGIGSGMSLVFKSRGGEVFDFRRSSEDRAPSKACGRTPYQGVGSLSEQGLDEMSFQRNTDVAGMLSARPLEENTQTPKARMCPNAKIPISNFIGK